MSGQLAVNELSIVSEHHDKLLSFHEGAFCGFDDLLIAVADYLVHHQPPPVALDHRTQSCEKVREGDKIPSRQHWKVRPLSAIEWPPLGSAPLVQL
ncbi:hypothetical protein Pka01_53750 [Planotetraspora kaengkrachanensis]|uniref:Uncharacterized protein n=1 Tax=Planotetraspora kaengkrachanensis TaxID=575193 RepID=A0A8J3PWJ5_9ACTN|nr:hypothetical protein Pka01_53750 [Planotetraspora kaengkrachanensis]